MKTEIHINIIDALKISHEILEHLSAYALEELLDAVKKELKKREDLIK